MSALYLGEHAGSPLQIERMEDLKENLKIIKEYLKLNSEIVGVKLLKDDIAEGHPKEGQFYCWFVRESAVSGKGFNLNEKDFTCPNPELCLGLREPKYVEVELRVKEKFRTVQVGDAENADVLLFIVNPRQLMELSILLGGITASFRGETAVCGEATARCYIEKSRALHYYVMAPEIFLVIKMMRWFLLCLCRWFLIW